MSVSIIIPTLNEAGCLAESLWRLKDQRPGEVIVADGGSTDETRLAAALADRYVEAPRGRARQMNAGAGLARGDVLLFLHADCVLEDGALAEAERRLQRRGVAAGCFTMRVDARGLLYRWIDLVARARVRLTGLVYGDQGLFLRRRLFEELGGFPPLGFLEDVFFSRKLRGRGRIVLADRRIVVSPRRWQRVGVVRQTIRNWTLLSLAAGGIPPDRLAGFYPTVRAKPET